MNEAYKSPEELKQAIQALREKIIKQVQENAKRREAREMIKQLDATESIEILQEYCSQLGSELQQLKSAIDDLEDSEALEDSFASLHMSAVMAAYDNLNNSLYIASLSEMELERLL